MAWLWWRLVDHLRIEWSVNPQYSYGWAVPFLCAYLIWSGAKRKSEIRNQKSEIGSSPAGFCHPSSVLRLLPSALFSPLLVLLAFAYAPIRLVQEANPEWRFVSWALALEVIAITMLAVYAVGRKSVVRGWSSAVRPPSSVLRLLVFPLCFFLVAVPWPTVIEAPLIQVLTRGNAAVTIELLGLLGVPAVQHGNVIEVATGMVGIDDACSGIRSFQATLMIALFLGELYSLSGVRRALLVLAGFALSFVFNVGRTSLLTWVAARDGVPAIARWHDPAGVIILVGCFLGLWLAAILLRKSDPRNLNPNPQVPGSTGDSPVVPGDSPGTAPSPTPISQLQSPISDHASRLKPHASGNPDHASRTTHHVPISHLPSLFSHLFSSVLNLQPSTFRKLAFGLALWLVIVETGTEMWYRKQERGLSPPVQWTLRWPRDAGGFAELTIAERSRQLLRYDEGKNAHWQQDGLQWQMIFLRWNAGRIAAHLARSHTPEVCLTAAGHELEKLAGLRIVNAGGLRLPFRGYSFQTAQGRVFVFYCLWEDRQREEGFDTESLSYRNRFEAVRSGRRNLGQRSLEVAVWGMPDAVAAETALAAQLERLIVVNRGLAGGQGH